VPDIGLDHIYTVHNIKCEPFKYVKIPTTSMKRDQSQLIPEADLVDVSIDKLVLDSSNVRFKHLSGRPSVKKIEEIIRNESDTRDLCEQIITAGVVYEPLVIDHDYVVLEGNRRLVAIRILKNEIEDGKIDDFPMGKFDTVKCRKLPKDVTPQTTDLYLASIHVRGKKPWKLFNRAKHIYRLNRAHGMSYDLLASHLGMGKVTIQRSILIYKLVLDYSRRFPDDSEWFHKYTYYEELFKRKDLTEFRNDQSNLDNFSKWIHDEKFHDHRDVRKLYKVLNDKHAFNEFKQHNFASALKILESEDPTLSNRNFKKILDSLDVLKSFSREELSDTKQNPAKMRLLYQLEAEAKSIIAELDALKQSKGENNP